MRPLLSVLLLLAVLIGGVAPTSTAHAGVVSVFCWNGNLGPLPAPMPTIGCTMNIIPAAGGGQQAFMRSTWSCTPGCFASSPKTEIGPFTTYVAGTVLDQIEANCASAGVIGFVRAEGRTVQYARTQVIVQEWSSDAVSGSLGFYCPFPQQGVGFFH